ncbi:hypothetical protein BD324DRAFT_656022 [Kockovaella imperatae]|uniref:MYND-type domain-containing protein n=1 Tax=Kockovaella imperatae TaxID=4999 RepID=A0A1Y1UHZ2_9TREE|nr:hypothetical protein BD324DRAFT_656022 [Kockovaella imperatae]ORX37671.1 hypothetical protein BD324DRAFT_656022 [Kockovaella imperatae]
MVEKALQQLTVDDTAQHSAIILEHEKQLERSDGKETDSEDQGDGATLALAGTSKSKKKKKKKKSAAKKSSTGIAVNPLLNAFPDELGAPEQEDSEVRIARDAELLEETRTVKANPMLLLESSPAELDILWTPSCRSLELLTPRLRLRQCQLGDLKMITKIKTEPIVNRTQLYGQPHMSWIKTGFLTRYIRSSIPQISDKENNGWKTDYIFAITLRYPSALEIGPPKGVMLRNRLLETDKAGYVGNFGLELHIEKPGIVGMRRKGKVLTHPTFAEMDAARVYGSLFYEIHPQLWGKGLISEAFTEVLRFAIEECGCPLVIADPTSGNDASIKLCLKNGMTYKSTTRDNPYNKPQLIHEIKREEWFKRNRGTKPVDRWGGKPVCRWCMNPRLSSQTIRCQFCDWARYCSRECQKADWVYIRGHRAECAGRN